VQTIVALSNARAVQSDARQYNSKLKVGHLLGAFEQETTEIYSGWQQSIPGVVEVVELNKQSILSI
jgi:hypothetical protein